MEQFTFANLFWPISYKKAIGVMQKFEASARATMGPSRVTITAYSSDYLVADEGSDISFQSVMLNPTNRQNLIVAHDNVADFSHDLWKRAKYIRMSIRSEKLANCFMRAHFKGTAPHIVSFDVKGCGSRQVYNAIRQGFTAEGHSEMRNTLRIEDGTPSVYGL